MSINENDEYDCLNPPKDLYWCAAICYLDHDDLQDLSEAKDGILSPDECEARADEFVDMIDVHFTDKAREIDKPGICMWYDFDRRVDDNGYNYVVVWVQLGKPTPWTQEDIAGVNTLKVKRLHNFTIRFEPAEFKGYD